MTHTHWLKQASDKPLFPDLLWSRPEQKSTAGKLLIIGGNLHGFAAPAQAYNFAEKAGIGYARVSLPDAIKKLVGGIFETGEFAPSTPSGSFSQQALGELLDNAAWSDGVLMSGDLGRNSETAILLEKFLSTYAGPLTLTKDAADYALGITPVVAKRQQTLLVLTMAQLQKLGSGLGFTKPFTFGMDLIQLVDALHELTGQYPVMVIVKHLEQLLVAVEGNVSTTTLHEDKEVWRIEVASYASVWWLQNKDKAFKALTTAMVSFRQT